MEMAIKEVIWYIDYSSTNQLYNQEMDNDIIRSGGNHTHLIFCMKYDDQPGMVRSIEYGRPFNHYMPTRYLLDCYDENIDQRFEVTFRSLWKANGGKTRDNYPYMVQRGYCYMDNKRCCSSGKSVSGPKDVIRYLIGQIFIMKMVL